MHDVHHLGAGARLGPGLVELPSHPEMGLHPGQQLPDSKWLGDEIRGAEAEGANRGLFRRHGGDHQDRQVLEPRISLYSLEQLQPIDLGHHDIEQEQVELFGGEMLEEVLAPGSGKDIVAVFLENPGQRPRQRLIVVRHQDLRRNGHHCTRRWNRAGSTFPPLTMATVGPVAATAHPAAQRW